jgi:glycopeptide antibiotics resistance protein
LYELRRTALCRSIREESERVLQPASLKSQEYAPLPEAARLLAKYGFYFFLAVFLYSVIFPFHFDFSWKHLQSSCSRAGYIPFWNAKLGLHIAGDDFANVLLTLPLGFLGYLHSRPRSGKWAIFRWGVLGLAFGLFAELMQLAIPTRSSGITDTFNNGLGTILGAVIASARGRTTLEFFTGAAAERRNIYLWMLIWSLVAMVGPYDLSEDSISHINTVSPLFETQPWISGTLMGAEWIRMAGFAMIGAFAARLAVPGRRKRTWKQPLSAAALVILLPALLQCLRLLVESEGPSLDDLAMDIFGALAGAFASLFVPPDLEAFSGSCLFTGALVAAGLSPYHFAAWKQKAVFQWIPFYDFCSNHTPLAFYETILNFFSFAILGGLLQMSFPRQRRIQIALYALAFSAVVEFAQTFLPGRTAGVTDICVAAFAAWTGAHVCAAIESERVSSNPSAVISS